MKKRFENTKNIKKMKSNVKHVFECFSFRRIINRFQKHFLNRFLLFYFIFQILENFKLILDRKSNLYLIFLIKSVPFLQIEIGLEFKKFILDLKSIIRIKVKSKFIILFC